MANDKDGRVICHFGEGKGKSSAALGMVFRAAGWGMKVLVVQFIKGKWKTGEERLAAKLDEIEWHSMGDGFTWDTKNPEADRATCQKTWAFAQEKICSGLYDLVLLDEINYCCGYGWLEGAQLARFITQEKPPKTHLILTGRNPAPEVLEVADTVTEMKLVKHAYSQGIKAIKGIEF
ncbi:MAG: cob(I)yrinic acid a,c-diamide adenosyltransferase [Candidatus Lambdaproteobacteria bacterium RIFOXYD2_FULL_50_16]|uniref:Corrinoid adenosyltransferase n=1 Tax=Candidatus Lambdaproteobacteria bacterium RIFOXYD2_FULL_50_16 TaxID=1817772 RepID=A0A1F6G8T9_9PROT|nr:MAG: cob(I)yrinic acid a,c-diamide adenosyltransferase [Candidatus Lambdaproteobacteria bacterium RIFOXYD2_FULL_50_16]